MAKVQAYVKDEVSEYIKSVVEKRKVEGAKDSDVSHSSVAGMLLELGVMVHKAQTEKKPDAFNQTEYNKILLENVLKSQFTLAKLLGMVSLSPHLKGESKFQYSEMVNEILNVTAEKINTLFPLINEEDE